MLGVKIQHVATRDNSVERGVNKERWVRFQEEVSLTVKNNGPKGGRGRRVCVCVHYIHIYIYLWGGEGVESSGDLVLHVGWNV